MTNALNKLDFQKNDSLQVIENYCIIILFLFPYGIFVSLLLRKHEYFRVWSDQINVIREGLDLLFPVIYHLETFWKDKPW